MTLDQFFEQLAATKETHQWRVRRSGREHAILGTRPDTPMFCCPITAVCHEPMGTSNFLFAAKLMGLNDADAFAIANAADAANDVPFNRPLRARLLSTLGLG